MTENGIVWRGAEALRPFLIPIADLEPWPGNPRRGDVKQLAQSLHRFGQTKAILTDASNGRRIVAGHHLVEAAVALDPPWTHFAAIPNEFQDEEEARAYLVADNRLHDIGPGYDEAELAEHLRALAELDALHGTGYTNDDVDGLLAELARAAASLDPPPDGHPGGGDQLDPIRLDEIVLMYAADQRQQFEEWLRRVAAREGTSGVSETVYRAVELAAG